jgi:hypothetical protein
MADARQERTDMLRTMWTQSASAIVEKLKQGQKVPAEEVQRLQETLEGIEGREMALEANLLSGAIREPSEDEPYAG